MKVRTWLSTMGLLGGAGVAISLSALIMFVGCAFGLYKSVEQANYHSDYRKRCEESGGVYRRGKYEAPACFDPAAFKRLPE